MNKYSFDIEKERDDLCIFFKKILMLCKFNDMPGIALLYRF
mgnify:CR=1 FL=1